VDHAPLDGVVLDTGALSGTTSSRRSSITAAGDFCLSVRNTKVDAQFWTADDVGLRRATARLTASRHAQADRTRAITDHGADARWDRRGPRGTAA
jgi:hypothetical protein